MLLTPCCVIAGKLCGADRRPCRPRCADDAPGRPVPPGTELLRITLEPGQLCASDGSVSDSPALEEFDRSIEKAAAAGCAVLLTLMRTDGAETGPAAERFDAFRRSGMLIWHTRSTEFQERYLGQLLGRHNRFSGRYLFEYPNIAFLRLYDSAARVLEHVEGYFNGTRTRYAEAFAAHRREHDRTRGDLPGAELERAFRLHILRRHIAFLVPMILHTFGNRALPLFGAGSPPETWREEFYQVLREYAVYPSFPEIDTPENREGEEDAAV